MRKIRICTTEDIEKLMEIGEKTFRETFEGENTQEDMEKIIAGKILTMKRFLWKLMIKIQDILFLKKETKWLGI